MTVESSLNLLAFLALAAVGIVPLIIALRVKVPSLRNLSLLLGVFALAHGFYHLANACDFDILADSVLEPVSVVFLLAFGFYYSKKGII